MAEVEFDDTGIEEIIEKKAKKKGRKKTVKKEQEITRIDSELNSELIEVDTTEKTQYHISLHFIPPGGAMLQTIDIKCALNVYEAKYVRDVLFLVEERLLETNEPQAVRIAYSVDAEDENGIRRQEEQTCAVTNCVGIIHNLPMIRSISEKA